MRPFQLVTGAVFKILHQKPHRTKCNSNKCEVPDLTSVVT